MITALRRALGERRGEHRFIMTVPGRGYRFVAQVRLQTPDPEKATAAPASSNREPPPRASIAVLPFTNMTGEKNLVAANALFEQALMRDPGFARALCAQATAYVRSPTGTSQTCLQS